MKPWIALAAMAACLMTACQSAELSPEEERTRMLSLSPAINSIPKSGLGPQQLDAGECGLFLWSKTDLSKFIFFSQALSGTALFAQDTRPMALEQTGAGGSIFGQFNTLMRYAARDGRTVELSLVPGDELEGGQRLESGLLTLTDSEGWVTKLPILGVRACQPE